MFMGDEDYGRNKGYYVLLDTFRDIFERGGRRIGKRPSIGSYPRTDIDKMR